MKIEVGHKDMLEFILLGTGQDTVGEAKKYIEENKLLGDLVQSMNNPQMWKVDGESTESGMVAFMDHYKSVSVSDIS
jgi:hypothetical protein